MCISCDYIHTICGNGMESFAKIMLFLKRTNKKHHFLACHGTPRHLIIVNSLEKAA